MIIKVYAWIPRSHVHVAEIANKTMKGIGLDIDEIYYDSEVGFTVKEFEGLKNVSFVLDGDGLYSVSIKLPDNDIKSRTINFYNKGRKLIMNIIQKCHSVTYSQIIEGILPINYSTVIFTNKPHAIKDYDKLTGNGITVYSNKRIAYTSDTFTYISGKLNPTIERITDYHAFTDIISHFFYEMMDKMESYHKGTKEVIRLLEFEPKSKLINTAYLNLDLVKKDAAESWAKIEQAIDCLYRKKELFEDTNFPKNIKNFIDNMSIEGDFNKLSADKDYVKSLWDLLISHLEYVDTAVEARINYKSMSAYKSQQWLGIINSGFILAAIIMTVFMVGTGQLNNISNFVVLIVAWIVFYELVNYLVIKRKY